MPGMILIHYSTSWFLGVLASIGSERVGVELYKTFLKRHVRGIDANRSIRHPVWPGVASSHCRSALQWLLGSTFWLTEKMECELRDRDQESKTEEPAASADDEKGPESHAERSGQERYDIEWRYA